MQIGIIGAGRVGGTLAGLLTGAGHEVIVSNSRGPRTLAELVQATGARAATTVEAARFGEVVIIAIPFGRRGDLPAADLVGKVLVDTTNYDPERDGQIRDLDLDETTSSELLAIHLPGARLVKAFNTIYWRRLRDAGRSTGAADRLALPVAGDDPAAVEAVSALIEDIGFDVVVSGRLAEGGRQQQPGAAAYNVPLTRVQLAALLRG